MTIPVPGQSTDADRPALMAEMNVTPFIDVMLVLLVVFIVTAPMLMAGAPVRLPKADMRPMARSQKPLVVTLTADRRFFVRDEAVDEAALVGRLSALRAEEGDRPLYLRADASVPYGEVVALIGRLDATGATRISLVSQIVGAAVPGAPAGGSR